MTSALRYFKGKRQSYGVPLLSSEWGEFTFYIEVDDQYVTRQVNEFENGNVLRYNREHWCDDFGRMFIAKFSRKQKAGRGMRQFSQEQFEQAWRRAVSHGMWAEQQSHSLLEKWGTWTDRVMGTGT